MDHSVFHHVSKETYVAALWSKLESLFEKKTVAKKTFLIKEHVYMKYTNDVHLNIFRALSISWAQLGWTLMMSYRHYFYLDPCRIVRRLSTWPWIPLHLMAFYLWIMFEITCLMKRHGERHWNTTIVKFFSSRIEEGARIEVQGATIGAKVDPSQDSMESIIILAKRAT